MLSDGGIFACRHCYQLAYFSSREDADGRATRRADRLRRRLDTDAGIGDYIAKPSGMRWRTYERLMARCQRYEGITNQFLVEWLRRKNR